MRSEQKTQRSLSGDPPDRMLSHAQELYRSGEYEQAQRILFSLVESGDKSFHTLKFLIGCFEKRQEWNEAVELLTSLPLQAYPPKESAALHFRLGRAYLKKGQHSLAKQSFWQIKRLVPNFPGLEDVLRELDQSRVQSKTRYDYLLEQGLVTKQQLDEALERCSSQDRDPDQYLMEQYALSKEDVGRSLSRFYGVSFVAFDPTVDLPFDIFENRNLDPDFLKKYHWVPFARNGPSIQVLTDNPYDLGKVDEIKFILGTSRVEFLVALQQDIAAFVDRFFQEMSGGTELAQFEEEVDSEPEQEEASDLESMSQDDDSEVVRLVNALLIEAWKRGASDIHVEPNSVSKYCAVRYRVDGTCHEFRKLRFGLGRPIISRIKIMARLDIAERRLPQDGKIKVKLPKVNRVVEFRVATIPTVDNQEDVVLRLLASGKPMPLESLGLSEYNLRHMQRVVAQPYGMILVVGPTGSGKTTTLHSAISTINTPEKKIWAVEDPVEITQEGLRQVQVNSKIGLTFASTLRSFLRADPDVIMIGEMRDRETAHIGVESSLTGHLVFSTLHTNSAPETITRLLDMDLDPFNFADSLLCVLAQRLVKTLCPKCKKVYTPSAEQLAEIKTEFGPEWERAVPEDVRKNPVLAEAVGCRHCLGGYKGRMGIHELMMSTPDIKNLIKFRKHTQEILAQAKIDGMTTLKQDGMIKVLQGLTTIEQVRSVAGGETGGV
ncbi:GspE/PulE family protein [Desulfovermiculus halophilus]|uniref:GspE/PulE family protein n=1 Tax=Desulfovermiculus halophilus TaxID=339722 RepID=UPI000B0C4AEB|nr:GspE/PulE family protein [Desulfovermiculus halophilus]